MTHPGLLRNSLFGLTCAATITLAIAFTLITVAPQPAHAQTFSVLHNFTGGQDGGYPYAGLTLDRRGNLYGTAYVGGTGCSPFGGCGTVFELKHQGPFAPLYSFLGSGDGAYPLARVVFGPNGTLYGTTSATQENGYYGVVFNVRPKPTPCKTALCTWMETPLYVFPGGTGGGVIGYGDLLFDQGNIYGTATSGGTGGGDGVVYDLTPSGSGWAESLLYSFSGDDGSTPQSGVIFDSAHNLYGTTYLGGLSNAGTAFELTASQGGWTESCLFSFRNGNDGSYPYAGLTFDSSGTHLYGANSNGGTGGGGTIFKLTPGANCSWTLETLYSFTGGYQCGPWSTLMMDPAGNLLGTTKCDGANGFGNVFKLTPSGGSWMYTSLHDFTGGSDGGNPIGGVAQDNTSGNLYGTASTGGSQGVGVVWEITP